MARSRSSELAKQVGMPPRAFAGGLYDSDRAGLPSGTSSTFVNPGRNAKGQRTTANQGKSKFNLRGVVEVLEEYGLDPTAEIAKALAAKRTINVGGVEEEVPIIDAETRAKLSLSLLEYVQPKLKSVEVTHKLPELTNEQIDARLEALLDRAKSKK